VPFSPMINPSSDSEKLPKDHNKCRDDAYHAMISKSCASFWMLMRCEWQDKLPENSGNNERE
jgi:hypothetical protein